MEKLTMQECRDILCKKLEMSDIFTKVTKKSYNEYHYCIGEGLEIVVFVSIRTDKLVKIELYKNRYECLITILPYKDNLKWLCKFINKVKEIKNND